MSLYFQLKKVIFFHHWSDIFSPNSSLQMMLIMLYMNRQQIWWEISVVKTAEIAICVMSLCDVSEMTQPCGKSVFKSRVNCASYLDKWNSIRQEVENAWRCLHIQSNMSCFIIRCGCIVLQADEDPSPFQYLDQVSLETLHDFGCQCHGCKNGSSILSYLDFWMQKLPQQLSTKVEILDVYGTLWW